MATIFIVDDEQDISEILVKSFKNHGYDVIGFTSSETLIRSLTDIKCSLIISDIKMPSINGIDLLKLMKQKLGDRHPPIVYFTAFKETYDEELLELGADAVFQKPTMFDEMVEYVESKIGRNSSSPN